MTDILRIKRRALGGAAGAPASLAVGEMAFNEVDGGLYIGRSDGSVVQVNTGGAAAASKLISGGRLTLASGTPVLGANTVSVGTVYYTFFAHNQVPIYDGTQFSLLTFVELSVVLDAANVLSGKLYDFFRFDNAGTIALGYGSAWTSNTARNDAIARLQGIWTNNAIITLRTSSTTTFSVAANRALYVGTIYANANGMTTMNFSPAAASGGSPNTILGVFNAYNRVPHICLSRDGVTAWSYAAATWRRAHGTANNNVSVVDGLGEVSMWATYGVTAGAPVISSSIGINLNSITGVPALQTLTPDTGQPTTGAYVGVTAHGLFPPALGYNTLTAMEIADGTNTQTFYGSGWGAPIGQLQGLTLAVMI